MVPIIVHSPEVVRNILTHYACIKFLYDDPKSPHRVSNCVDRAVAVGRTRGKFGNNVADKMRWHDDAAELEHAAEFLEGRAACIVSAKDEEDGIVEVHTFRIKSLIGCGE